MCAHPKTNYRSTRSFVIVFPLLILGLFTGSSTAQISESRTRNNPYSPSPNIKGKEQRGATPKVSDSNVSFVMQKGGGDIPPSSALNIKASGPTSPAPVSRPVVPAVTAAPPEMPLTETYRVGPGDVLLVTLRNASQGSGYFTVRQDGTIDYPLAGQPVAVSGRTTEFIQRQIAGGITLFSDPHIEVKVRQFGSHTVTVAGLVDNPGEKHLQREAMPLFAIRAEAVVQPAATRVRITRGGKTDSFDLSDAKTGDVLIFPDSTIEFTGSGASGASYFIGGEIGVTGQRELTAGLTLYQAIVANGPKGDPRKAIIRRKNTKGMLESKEHDVRSIRSGKSQDPILAGGDIVEIRN